MTTVNSSYLQKVFLSVALLATMSNPSFPIATATTTSSDNDSPPAVSDDTTLPPLLPGTSIIVRLDIGKIELPDLPSITDPSDVTNSGSELASKLTYLRENLDVIKREIGSDPINLLFDMPISIGQPMVRLAMQTRDQEANDRVEKMLARFEIETQIHNQGWVVANLPISYANQLRTSGAIDDTLTSLDHVAIDTVSFAAAMKQAGDAPIQIALVPPHYLWKTYEELMPELPVQLGGGPVTRLTHGLRWLSVGCDLNSMKVDVTVQSASSDAANEFSSFAPVLLRSVFAQLPLLNGSSDVLARIAKLGKAEIKGDQIHFALEQTVDSPEMLSLIVDLVGLVIDLKADQEVKPKLRQLALAIHNYEFVHSGFPPAAEARDQTGESGLSWRVHILPYLDEMELYQQFKLDQPWDSPHNRALIAKMPSVFKMNPRHLDPAVGELPEGHTTLVAPVGEGTIFGGKEVMTFGKIVDGSSNTVLLVQVKPEFAVPWTAPQDYTFDPNDPGQGLNIGRNEKFIVAMADGSVLEIRSDLPGESIKYLFQVDDGQIVDFY